MAEKGQIELPILADLEPLMEALDKAIAKVSKTTEEVGKQTEKVTKTMEKQGQSIKKGIEEPLKSVDSTSKSVFSKMKDTVSSATSTMKEKFTSGFNAVKEKVSEVGQKIGTAIKTGINTAVQFVKTGTENMKAKFREVGTACTELGNKIAGVGAKMSLLITTPIVALGKSFITAAQNLEQTQRRTQTIFGEMASDIEAFAMANEKTFGLGSGTIQAYINDIADLAQGLGMAEKASVDFSKGAMELGVQLANWGNVDSSTAIEDIQSALMGSTKAVQKYGIKLTDATLSQAMLDMGIKGTFDSLDEATKAQVRYTAMVNASANAISYWEEGNRSNAYYMGEIKEQMGNVAENIGNVLLPVVEKITKKVSDFSYKLAQWSAENPELIKSIVKIAGAIATLGPVLMIGGKLISVIGGIMTAIGSLSAPIVLAIAGIGALFVAFKNNTGGIRDTVVDIVGKIQKCFANNMPKIQGIFEDTMELLQTIWADIGEPLFSTFGTLLSDIVDIFTQLFPHILDIFNGVIQGISDFWNTLGKPVFDVFIEIVNWLWETIMAVMPSILSIVSSVFESISSVWNGVLKPVLERLGTIFTEHIKPAVDKVLPPLMNLIQTLGDVIKNIFDNFIKPKIDDFISWLQLLGKIASPILDGIMWAFDGITSAIGWALDKLDKFLNLFRSNKGEIAEASNVGKTISVSYETDTSALTDIPNMRLGISERLGSVMNTLTSGYRFVSDFDFIDSSSSKTTQKVSVNDMKKSNNQKSTIKTAIFIDKRQIVEAVADGVDTKNNEYVELETRRIGGRIAW